jgi:hypothetical protein
MQLVTAFIIHYDVLFLFIDNHRHFIFIVGDVESDIQATQLIGNCLTSEKTLQTYPTIDAICRVANSNMKMASSAQSNVIEAVKFLFGGCDYASKAHLYFTFAIYSKKMPAVLKTIPPIIFPRDLYYEFENSILFTPKPPKIELPM